MLLFSKKEKQSINNKTSNIRKIPTEEYFKIIREQLDMNGRADVRITGVSMKPFLLPIRDSVEIIPPDNSLRRGDIVLYDTHHGRYILHRVIRIGEKDFDMRGDNTIYGENGLVKNYIMGIVTRVRRNGKTIERDSVLFKTYAKFSPIHYTWKVVWQTKFYPVASKIYHVFK